MPMPWLVLITALFTFSTRQPAVPPANPQTAREWRQAAQARQRQKDLDGAMHAYRKALELEPDAPATIYGIGNLFALKHDVEAAFEWLQRAKATGRWDMS